MRRGNTCKRRSKFLLKVICHTIEKISPEFFTVVSNLKSLLTFMKVGSVIILLTNKICGMTVLKSIKRIVI